MDTIVIVLAAFGDRGVKFKSCCARMVRMAPVIPDLPVTVTLTWMGSPIIIVNATYRDRNCLLHVPFSIVNMWQRPFAIKSRPVVVKMYRWDHKVDRIVPVVVCANLQKTVHITPDALVLINGRAIIVKFR